MHKNSFESRYRLHRHMWISILIVFILQLFRCTIWSLFHRKKIHFEIENHFKYCLLPFFKELNSNIYFHSTFSTHRWKYCSIHKKHQNLSITIPLCKILFKSSIIWGVSIEFKKNLRPTCTKWNFVEVNEVELPMTLNVMGEVHNRVKNSSP